MNSGRTYDKSVLFGFPGADRTSASITVSNAPVHIIASNLPEDCLIRVERLYAPVDIHCEPDVPPADVYCPDECDGCNDGCDLLYLFNVEDTICPSGRKVQNELWLVESGHYRLVMESMCDPEMVFVYAFEDPLIKEMDCCPTNVCLPKEIVEIEECPCCDEVAIQPYSAGGGVCVRLEGLGDYGVWQSRDGATIIGAVTAVSTGNPISPLTGNFTSPFDDCPAVLEVDVTAHAEFTHPTDVIGEDSLVFVFSDTLAEAYPSFQDIRFNESAGKAYIVTSNSAVESVDSINDVGTRTPVTIHSGATNLKFLVPAGGTQVVYGQWWYIIRDFINDPAYGYQITHGDMRFRATWHKGGFQI